MRGCIGWSLAFDSCAARPLVPRLVDIGTQIHGETCTISPGVTTGKIDELPIDSRTFICKISCAIGWSVLSSPRYHTAHITKYEYRIHKGTLAEKNPDRRHEQFMDFAKNIQEYLLRVRRMHATILAWKPPSTTPPPGAIRTGPLSSTSNVRCHVIPGQACSFVHIGL